MLLNYKEINRKFIWMVIRLVLNCLVFWHIFSQPGFTDELCGPLAIPVAPNLYKYIIYIEIAYLSWPIILNYSSFRKLKQMNLPKNIFILILKLLIILNQTQRLKYYMHVAILQLTIMASSAIFDIIAHPTISEAWEIIVVDSFHKIAIFYEITRTFCPHFAIYWFITNLFLLLLSQLEAHAFYHYPNSQRMEPIYPLALYVKQDIYRIMIIAFGYFGLFALLQAKIFGYGMLFLFIICAGPLLFSIRKVHEGQFKKSLFTLILVCCCFCLFLVVRIKIPNLFKQFTPKYGTCYIFDTY